MAATIEGGYTEYVLPFQSRQFKSSSINGDWKTYYHQLRWLDGCITHDQLSLDQRLPHLLQLREMVTVWKSTSFQYDSFKTLLSLATTIAYKLCDWPLLIFIHEHWPDNTIPSICIMATAYQQLGRYQQAISLLTPQILLHPNDKSLMVKWQSLYCDNNTDLLVDKELSLTPLRSYHMESFSWQYTQSVIDQCNLMDFQDQVEWRSWYRMVSQENERVLFAVIHQEWGFVGCVNLQVYEGVGFFYYWFGDDFQGCGFGPRSVNLLLHYGYHHMAMDCCYAKVFDYNQASHKAIAKVGFSRLNYKAKPPYDNEVFYYLGPERPALQYYQDLSYLLSVMESPLEIYPGKCAATWRA